MYACPSSSGTSLKDASVKLLRPDKLALGILFFIFRYFNPSNRHFRNEIAII